MACLKACPDTNLTCTTRLHCRLLTHRLGIDLLCRAHRASELNRLPRGFGDYMFEGGQHSHRVQIIVVADVSDAEKVSLHLGLSVGHDRAKLLAEEFANGSGIGPRRRSDGSQCGRWRTGREQL